MRVYGDLKIPEANDGPRFYINVLTVGDPNLSSIPYRTVAYRSVQYRIPLQFLSRSRSLSARRTVFFPA
jgi:hypothetical protein